MKKTLEVACIAGARPNFMKIAPILEAFREDGRINARLIHTGQHYDKKMSDQFFTELGIPEPDVNLNVGSGTHGAQTGAIMTAFEKELTAHPADAVIVVGDVNSTVGCGLVAAKAGVTLVHVEAGLRSFDRTMPEEINRIVTDSISDILYCTEQSGVDNLHNEGVSPEKVHLVGNVMVDTLFKNLEKADQRPILKELGLGEGEYALVTLHRPSNVDTRESLEGIVKALTEISERLPIVWPVHPRCLAALERFDLKGSIEAQGDRIRMLEPVGYHDMVKLMKNSRLVLSDSGGLQEETTALRVPCLTMRPNTERPVTCEMGSNQLIAPRYEDIRREVFNVMENGYRQGKTPPFWDGHAAERICAHLYETLSSRA